VERIWGMSLTMAHERQRDNAIASTPAPSISGLLTRKSKKTDPVVHENEIKQK